MGFDDEYEATLVMSHELPSENLAVVVYWVLLPTWIVALPGDSDTDVGETTEVELENDFVPLVSETV